jgi:uncharacterized protein (TIGR03083 family)
MHIHHVIPIEVNHLFPVLDAKLVELLRSLSEDDWHKPTIATKWRVKDIAAHLLDGNLRHLSISRDKYYGETPGDIGGYRELVSYLDRLNADWVAAFKRVSPNVLTDLLESSGKEYADYITTLDPWAEATFPVSWAGEEISNNWFHIAREYTEKWLHQQQIREAVGKEPLFNKELFHPFISTMMCGLSHTYKNTEAPTGTSVLVSVTGLDEEWHINKTDEGWVLRRETRLEPNVKITLDMDTAWKVFSKGIAPEMAREKTIIEGDIPLGMVALNMVSVMA